MMRDFIIFLLLVLLLTGCGRAPAETTLPPVTEIAAAPAEVPTVPATPPPTAPAPTEPPSPEAFVRVTDYISDIQVELKYATEDNFTGQVIYDFQEAYLRYGTVEKLAAAQLDLQELGFSLKLWDAFRPTMAQFALWEVCPDSTYVADPRKGYSSHSRGNTVDVTLVDSQGREVTMPTGFDDFSSKADRFYGDCTQEEADNAQILELILEKHGFQGYAGEWWHFSDTTAYPVEQDFQPTA